MFNLKEIVNKIKPLLSKELQKRATYKDVAEALCVPYNRFRQQIHKNIIPFEEIMIFCSQRKISINYIFFNQLPQSLIQNTEQLITLKYSSTLGSLGDGLENYELEPVNITLDQYLLDFIQCNYYSTEIIKGFGDSMEPLIQDNSILFIDRSKTTLLNNRIYAFTFDNSLFIKQYSKSKNEFISFNKSYKNLKSENCRIIGRVVGVLTKF